MRILITGHTGFKGGWLAHLLSNFGHELFGYSDKIPKNGIYQISKAFELFSEDKIANVQNETELITFFEKIKPDIVIHLAAQPIVLKSYKDQLETYHTNVNGTLNVLEAVNRSETCGNVLIITSDKVYKKTTNLIDLDESCSLGGGDPYSNSKAMADLLAQAWIFDNKNKKVVIARAGNVIGAGDVSENRLIPDFFRALSENQELVIRNKNSIRPWQHVLACLNGYLHLIDNFEKIENHSAWNFGPVELEKMDVQAVIELFQERFPISKIEYSAEGSDVNETKFLGINSNKSVKQLKWKPKYNIHETVAEICTWYEGLYDGVDPVVLTKNSIKNFL
jgi:CDP-glucose 4,6-dehydratase